MGKKKNFDDDNNNGQLPEIYRKKQEIDPYDSGLLMTDQQRKHRIIDNLNQASICFVDAGRDLFYFKDTLPLTGYLKLLEEVEISEWSANGFIRVAKAAERTPKVKQLAKLGRTKLYAILQLGKGALDEYQDKGTVLGMPYDELAAKTTRELQDDIQRKDKKIEKLEKQKEAGQGQLKGKGREIEELEAKLKGQIVSGDEDKVLEALSDVRFELHRLIHRLTEKISWTMSDVTVNEAAGTMEVIRAAADDLFDRFTEELKGLQKKKLFEDVLAPVLGHTRELKHEKDMREKAASIKKPGRRDA